MHGINCFPFRKSENAKIRKERIEVHHYNKYPGGYFTPF